MLSSNCEASREEHDSMGIDLLLNDPQPSSVCAIELFSLVARKSIVWIYWLALIEYAFRLSDFDQAVDTLSHLLAEMSIVVRREPGPVEIQRQGALVMRKCAILCMLPVFGIERFQVVAVVAACIVEQAALVAIVLRFVEHGVQKAGRKCRGHHSVEGSTLSSLDLRRYRAGE